MSVILKAENIGKSFSGLVALEGINIEVNEGEIFGLIGPNGAGKTTLFNVMTGFYPSSTGKVFFQGEDMSKRDIDYYCKKGMARTFQNIRIFSEMTVLDNLLVGMHNQIHPRLYEIVLSLPRQKRIEKEAREKAEGILDYLGILSMKDELASSLPYGSQRKVEIGRALASNPKLILLDEPTAGMNDQETMDLMELIKGIRGMGHTVFVIEHNMKFMMNLCERIAVLNFGKLLAVGEPAEIQANPEVIAAYLGSEEDDD